MQIVPGSRKRLEGAPPLVNGEYRVSKLMVEVHNWRKKLEKIYIQEHAPWAQHWAECLAFLCQCRECKAFLVKNEVDIKMVTRILSPSSVNRS